MPQSTVILRCSNCLILNRVPQKKLGSKPSCGNCKAVLDFPCRPVFAKNESFDRAVAYWPETLLIEFTAATCVHCRIFEPIVNDLARERAGKLKVMKVDVDTDDYLTRRFKVTQTPTFIVYKNAVEIIRVDGSPKEKTDLVKWIDNLINFRHY